jgi:hypothetical protein
MGLLVMLVSRFKRKPLFGRNYLQVFTSLANRHALLSPFDDVVQLHNMMLEMSIIKLQFFRAP